MIVVADEPALERGPAVTVPRVGGRDLWLRVASALVLAQLAVAAAYLGGALFICFWLLGASWILWEWLGLVAAAVTGLKRRSRIIELS